MTLEELSARLKKLDRVGVEIAADAGPGLLAEARRTAAAATAPDGAPWAPLKRGAGAPMPGAAAALRVEVSGLTSAVVTLTLGAPYTFLNYGEGKRIPARPILPRRATQAMRDVVARSAAKVLGVVFT